MAIHVGAVLGPPLRGERPIGPHNTAVSAAGQTPQRLTVANGGPTRFNSVLVEISEARGMASSIDRVDREIE